MNVLVVDDEPIVRRSLDRAIPRVWRDACVASVASLPEAERALEASRPDVLMADLGLSPESTELEGLRLVTSVVNEGRARHAVVMTGRRYADDAARRAGAKLVLHKPVRHEELREAGRKLGIPLVGDPDTLEPALLPLVGSSKAMRELHDEVRRISRGGGPILIQGETGTGKELVARAIHGLRGNGGPFHALNCSTLAEGLADSQLFGHARGAFTSAVRAERGAIEQAGDGVLFLDEIGDLPRSAQAKLLRVLEGHEFQAVGDERWIKLQARLVSACNVDLEARVAAGTFREDLYHRVAIHHLRIPPLRERPEDVPELVQALQKRRPQAKNITGDAVALLATLPWPGNVRQLGALLERASAASWADTIDMEDVVEVANGMMGLATRPALPGPAKARVFPGQVKVEQEAVRQRLYEQALAESNNNTAAAARKLGVGRMALVRWLQKRRGR